MTILFAGNSGAGFSFSNLARTSSDSTAGRFDSAYVPLGIDLELAATMTTPVVAAGTDMWFHFEYFFSGSSTFFDSETWVIRSGSTNLFRHYTNNGVSDKLEYWNGTGWVTLLTHANIIHILGDLVTVDIHCVMDNTVGVLDLYINGQLTVASFSGDTILTTPTDMDNLVITGADALSSSDFVVSQVIIADEDTRNLKVFSATTTGAGTTNSFTSGSYADIDEEGAPDDTDALSSGTAAQVYTGAIENLPAGKIPMAVCVNARAITTAGAPTQAQLALRSGSTDYFSATKSVDTALGPIFHVFDDDPDTAIEWTEVGFNAIEAGIKSIT